jgi:hypothetical protein
MAFLDPELAAVRLEAKGMPPLRQYFTRLGKGGSAHPRTQRSAIPAPPAVWLNHAVFGDQEGADGVR